MVADPRHRQTRSPVEQNRCRPAGSKTEAHTGHARVVAVSSRTMLKPRSTSLPARNTGPARTRATRWAALRARQRSWVSAADELERHGQAGRLGVRAFGDLGPQPHRGEGRLGVGRLEVHLMLGREIEKGEQYLDVIDDLGSRLGPFRLVVALQCLDRSTPGRAPNPRRHVSIWRSARSAAGCADLGRR